MNRGYRLAVPLILGIVITISILFAGPAAATTGERDPQVLELPQLLPSGTPLPPMWIADISIKLLHPPPHQYQARVIVTIVDANGPVEFAGVNGYFEGSTESYAGGETNASGEATLTSVPTADPLWGWTFCVTFIDHYQHVWDEAHDVEKCESIRKEGTFTPTPFGAPTPTMVPCVTPTSTNTNTPTSGPPATPSLTSTATQTPNPTETPLPANTETPSPTDPPTSTNTPSGRPTKTPVPPTSTPGGDQLHVADLDGSSAPNGDNRWDAMVEITVVDQVGAPIASAAVSGSWSSGVTGAGSCVTDGFGKCSVTRLLIRNLTPSVTFSVTSVSAGGFAYDPGANADPDGDSDGTTIVVLKP